MVLESHPPHKNVNSILFLKVDDLVGGVTFQNSLFTTLCEMKSLGSGRDERHDGPLGQFFKRELYRTVHSSVQEQLLRSIEKQIQGGLVFKAGRLLYHSTLGRE